ncbi:hypothetical protein PHYPO_G00039840 [Pangasianodon hypophthalmus]|uniref:DUF4211 domain-containing protein n=1 Tax=Pangasianodon hypophthalmus TaxID=310915 RepID=A0A5N5MH37_PANHP|nr:hypothetical protein PHYPO_G00039840 [Pangasianodon hypophthalmus]
MDRNYPGAGFGELGAGTGWSYERSAKASLMYGSSRSSHPDSELLHRQAYATPHPLQGYATNHHPGSSGQAGAWGAAGRSLGLSGLFDAGLHHASPSGPDASVMNLISALESRGPQPPPSASSLLSQFRTPSWQTAMHTPAPAELFISSALPGSGSFASSSALSAYQHPASFSGRSFSGVTPSLSLQDTPTFSPTSNGLLSPHDPLLHIKTPSQSSLGFDRLLSSQSAAAYRGAQEPSSGPQPQAPTSSSARHLPPPQFNLLTSQLQEQSSHLYNASVFSSAPAPSQPPTPQERAIPRQDSVIKHYQRPSPAQSQLPSSTSHPLQHYLSCGASGYQQISHHRHGGMNCSPLGDQSPSSDPKPSPRSDQVYRPIVQPPYSSSSTSSSAASGGGIGKSGKSSSSSSGYSSSSSSSSRTPHTPPSASSTTSSSSTSSNPSASSSASSAPSRQQPPPQSAPQPPPPPPPPLPVSSSATQQPPPKPCLSTYGSPVAPVKPTSCLPGQTPPQQHSQSYSPSQPPPSHLSQPYGGFSSPQAQEVNSGPGGSGKGFGGLGATGRSFSGEGVYGSESGYGSLPPSLGGAGSPSMGYDGTGHSPALIGSGGGTGSTNSGTGSTGGSSAANSSVASGGAGGSYHLPDSSPSPSINSAIIRPGLHSPAPTHPAPSPGGSGGNKYLSSVLSPNFLASPQGYSDTRAPPPQAQPYHSAPPKSKSESDMLGIERSQEEDEDDDDFLIQHLLHSQSPAPHPSQHHTQQQPPQVTSQQQSAQPQSMPQSREEAKGMSAYELNKASEERYQLQSVIRTNNVTNNVGPGTANTPGQGTGPGTGQESQLEISLKKQQTKIDRTVSGAGANGGRGGIDSLPHSHQHAPHTHQHDSLGSVVHYGRGDSYAHQTHQHHSSHSSHPQHSQHPQHSHPHSLSHAHVEVKKATDTSELPYIRKPPDLQQQRSQTSLSHMDSPPDQTQQSQQTHLLQSVLSHSTHNKMDTQQVPQPTAHPMSQQALMGPSGGLGTGSGGSVETQSQPSQLQLQLQSQSMEAHYGCEAQRNQSQSSQNSVSQLEMLERSLSRTNSREGAGPTERIVGGDGSANDHQRPQQQLQQQHRMPSHHQTHHPQQTPSELHDFLNESNLSMSAPSHLHHMASHHGHPHSHHQSQPHPHHQHSHQHSRHMPTNTGPMQTQAQPREPEPQLPQSQLDQLKEHQFDTESSVVKTTQNQGQSQQQQQRFVPLTSICFPDSLLQDEDRSFFPAMEDMFCSEDYKPSCAGGAGAGQGDQDIVSEAHVNVQDGIESVKTGGGAGGYDLMGHHGDQGYGQYCHSLSESGNGTMHLDLDSLKTHELPSTVNTEQLGLIQSQAPGMGMGGTGSSVDGTGNKIMGNSGVGSGSGTGGLTSPIFCSSRPKKLLKTSSFHLLKQRRDPNSQPQTKKTYAQEYEFEDDEDKADAPADIRLNSRRLPDLLPDLVSSCRKSSGSSGVGGLSPLMGDLDFCNPSGYSSLGPPPQLLPNDGPKKRGRKPTKPKREGPPRPRGRPRIRPLPEPPYCRGLMGPGAGESRRGRGRGRGRGRKDDLMLEMHRDINKGQNYHQQSHQQAPHLHHQQQLQQQHPQQQHLPQHQHLHHHSQPQQHLHPQQQHMHQQQHLHTQHHQHLHQQQTQHQQQQHQPQQQYQEPVKPIKIKLPLPPMPSSESLLRTDSLSSTDPVLSDGSVGSAPSLGLSPGPTSTLDMNRTDMNCGQDKLKQKDQEMSWERDMDEQLTPEAWATMQKLSSPTDDKPSELKSGFITSFLDFLKTEKKPPSGPLHMDGSSPVHEPSVKGGIRPLSPPPPPPPPPTPPPFGETEGEGGLALSNCPSPCKRLDEELKRNLETLPSFSSDEEDSVSKNQDLQKSISSAISALYDTPHSLAALPPPPTPSPPPSQAPPLDTPPPPADSETFPELETRMMTHELQTHTELNLQDRTHTPEEEDEPIEDEGPEELGEERTQKEEDKEDELEEDGGEEENIVQSRGEDMEKEEDAEDAEETEFHVIDAPKVDDSSSEPPLAPAPPSPPSLSPSPPTSSSPSPLPPPLLSIPSPLPAPEEDSPQPQPQPQSQPQPQPQLPPQPAPLLHQSLPPSPSPPALPSPSPPPPTLPPSATPPPSSSPPLPMELPHPSPPSPPTPEDAPTPQITSLHLAKKQDNAAIAGESEEEDSESGGEGIFRERDEFVVRTEDIGTLKLALQTGREPPPIWRVQKALLQKFAPEIKDGQRQFCATSNYLGYFGDAKMRYQRLYVKFLENVNKKDYVRVCSRKPWHRAGIALRRQSLAKPPPTIRSQTPPRVEREEREKARERERQREREQHEQRERERVKERERREREKEKEREKEAEQREKEKQEKEKEREMEREREREEREREKQREKEREKQREKERAREREKQQEKEKEKEREREKQREREREKERQKEKEREKQREKEREEKEREREREKEREKEKKLQERQNQEKLERRGGAERGRVREEKRGGAGGEKRAEKAKSRTVKVKAEPPPKKRKKWLKEVPSSESDSSPSASEDEGSVRSVINSRAMREMFRSYVEMLVSTALDPDMIQALEDTNDELYLPPMRKIDSILNEQKRRLLRRVNMNTQHQEALHMYPQMSADALESGMVKVRLGGEGYNRKTLNRVKKSLPKQQDLKLSTEMCRIYSLYHSLHHYKYHTFLHCKKETDSIEQAADDPGQEEVVQQCMANQSWLETLFNSFIELLTLSNKP